MQLVYKVSSRSQKEESDEPAATEVQNVTENINSFQYYLNIEPARWENLPHQNLQ
jgi:hypothetical protein